jgi:outer membrane protein
MMRNTASILAKVTLSLLIAGSIAACNQKAADTKTTTAAPSASTVEKPEIVYINQDSLLTKYSYFKDMTSRLETKGKAAQSDLASREQAIQRQYIEYQKNAATMSADQRAATEQRLQQKGQEYQTYRQNAGAQVQNEQMSEQTKLYEKISDFCKVYAKEKGYKMILTYQKGNATMLYGDPSLDVTADVIKRLNEAYTKDKK